ncbi:hypothetical protein U9M48_018949 [Paspalum notatum var. saurae]|uniref:Fe2OG dioxygenase domain-containing protein n=1 Tax=Paspalum notatum var. saurae TaxID=547442 RepID=A0AAQ3WQA1_PASNO
MEMTIAGDEYDDEAALAVFDFHESRGGVCGLVESGVTKVPPLFVTPTAPISTAAGAAFVAPTVDLLLPRSHVVALVGAAARSCGLFQVTNHGIPAVTIDSALSAIRAFNEQPLAARSAYYSTSPTGAATYATIPIPLPSAGQPANAPLLPWRDSLSLRLHDGAAKPDLDHLPKACRDALLEYHRSMTGLGKEIARLLSEALGVGAEQLERATQLQGGLMQCHYYPPCPQPERVLGSRHHTDGDLFTVLAQDGLGGLQVRLDDDEDDDAAWLDVVPVTGALLINIGDVLKVVSNDNYKSVEHRVVIKSTKEARVSIALFFKPAKLDDSHFFGPLPELVTQEMPARYRSLTWPELLDYRKELGHARTSVDKFKL